MKKKYVFSTAISMFINLMLFAQSSPYSDCQHAFNICALGNYHFESLYGAGDFQSEIQSASCTDEWTAEKNSLWLSWKVKEDGILVFTITPDNRKEDVDFILFKKSDGSACSGMEDVRCMASGINLGTKSNHGPCLGDTGLNHRSIDEIEYKGCKYDDDNYLKYLKTETGEEYTLMINNYSSSGGVSIYFDGTTLIESNPNCRTQGDLVDFEILEVYPNPTYDKVFLHLVSTKHQVIRIELVDVTGRLFKEQNWKMQAGQQVKEVLVNDVPKGSYLLRVKSEEMTLVKKVIVQ